MSKKTKSTTDQATHTVITPTNPEWVTDPVKTLAGKINDLSNLDPYSLVAGADPLQTQAAAGAANLTTPAGYGRANHIFNSVAGAGPSTYSAQTGSAASLLDNLSSYMSPYLNDVVGASLGDYDYGAGQTRAQNRLALAQDDTFGGSGGALQTAMSEDAIARGRGALASQLRDQAFQTGANLSGQDAARRQQMTISNMDALNQAAQFNAQAQEAALQRRLAAGSALVSSAGAQSANERENIATQASIGDMMRQIEAARRVAPISALASETGLLNSLPLGLFHGQTEDGTMHGTTTTTESDPIGAFSSLATGLGSLMGAPLPVLSFGGGQAGAGAAGAAAGGSMIPTTLGGYMLRGATGGGWGWPRY
jgi:hypothetical protein